MTPTENTIAIMFLTAALGLVTTMYWRSQDAKQRALTKADEASRQNAQEIQKLRDAVTELQTKVSPLWASVQQRISNDLHHPDVKFHEMDGLLEKLESLTISNGERHRLKELLDARSVDMDPLVTQSQRDSAKIMAIVMEKVVKETAQLANAPLAMVGCVAAKDTDAV